LLKKKLLYVRKVPIKLINTTETFKIIHYRGIIGKSFIQASQHKETALHSSRLTSTQQQELLLEYSFLCHWPLGLLLLFFQIWPENTVLSRKHIRISLLCCVNLHFNPLHPRFIHVTADVPF